MASPMENPQLTPLDVARFWSRVDVGNELECWKWKGTEANNGYGEFRLGGKTVKAHRISYFLMHGKALTPTEVVMHKCDVRLCVNPLHLQLGTFASNIKDCVAKGRNARGEKNYNTKLTAEQVMDIRFAPMLAKDLAAKHGVSIYCVYSIRGGKSWKHLPLNNTVPKEAHKRRYWRKAV